MNKRIEESLSRLKLPAQKIKLKSDDKYHLFIDVENISMEILRQQEVQDVMTDQTQILVKGYRRKNLTTKVTITAELKSIKTDNKEEEAIANYFANVLAFWG